MEITEIRVNLVGGPSERVKAFCTITLDGGFVVRDLKVIEGPSGLFLAMPSRKLADRCPRCAAKNHLRARFCNHCGGKLNESRAPRDEQGRVKLHADVAHPINAECRDAIQVAVIEAFNAEVGKSGLPGYQAASETDGEFAGAEYDEFIEASRDSRDLAYPESSPPRIPADSNNAADRPFPRKQQPDPSPQHRQSPPQPGSPNARPASPSSPPESAPSPPRRGGTVVADDEDGFGAGIL